jgi:hypothetical protein
LYKTQANKIILLLPLIESLSCAALVLDLQLGSAKANGREPKMCMGRVFNFKLGSFVMYAIARHTQARLSLELITQPRFHPVSLSLYIV